MNVLVTGGAGFIGSHLVELLLEKGHKVTVLDNLSQGKRAWVHPKANFIEGNILDYGLLSFLCKDKEAVFHLAAMSRVLPSLTQTPIISFQNNVQGTLNVLEACKVAKVKKVIYSASSTVYGNIPAPQHEDTQSDPLTMYALSKYAGELYCWQYLRNYGLNTVSLRYFQVYGPRQPIEGEYAMVTGIFLDQKKKNLPLTIHGDGSQKRDFIHVRDIAKANLAALEGNIADINGVCNVGTGISTSIQELANMISQNQAYTPARKFDMLETRASKPFCENMIDLQTGINELLINSNG